MAALIEDLVCPTCHAVLAPGSDERCCPSCGARYPRLDGVWRMMAPGRADAFRRFIEQYETVRHGEGRRVQDSEHLRALPFRDLSGERRYEWFIRSRSFATLIARIIGPLERQWGVPLRILDVGSGLSWLSNRLALRGHGVAAIDLLTNDFDGLGVHRHYLSSFLPVQAEFDRLPFADASVDLVIYNASFHYSSDYVSTLREAWRVLVARGAVVIVDSPIYRDPSSGAAMVREREDSFQKRFGFRGDSMRSENFLTYGRLRALADELALRWELVEPWYGVRWWLKPLVARVRGTREPARFKLVVGRRRQSKAPAA